MIVMMTCMSIMIFGQTSTDIQKEHSPICSILYTGNLPSLPAGGGVFIHAKELSFFTTIKGGTSYSGDGSIVAYDNSGVYQIGTWGNVATGKSAFYTTNNIFRIDFGMGYAVYHKNNFFVRPYIGVGVTKRSSTTDKFLEAEDVSSGYNVLGYYWVNNGSSSTSETKANFTFGVLAEKSHFSFGLGYDFNPKGVVLLAGFNF